MKKKILAFTAFFSIIGALYAAGVNHFTYYSYPNTTFNGNNYGNLSKDKIKEAMDTREKSIITLKEGEIISKIDPNEIKLAKSYDENYIKLNNNQYAWPLEIFKEHKLPDVPYKVTFDKDLLSKALDNTEIFKSEITRKPSTDATIIKGENSYEIADGVLGNEIDKDKLMSKLTSSLEKGEEVFSFDASLPYKDANIKKDDPKLNKELEALNKWKDTNITVNINGDKVTIANWENSNGLQTSSEEGFAQHNSEIYEKIAKDLSQKYNTRNKEREFESSTGKEVTLEPGTFGLALNQEKLVEELNDKVAVGQIIEIEAPMSGVSYGSGNNDIGKSYVEIDLSTQHLWLYKNGDKVLDTPIVSGNPLLDDRITPTGVYYVLWKQTQATLVGETYEQPVDYWMPFTDEGHGLHDAGWIGEESFGGDTLLVRGSHGCINLPPTLAPEIYNEVESGTPIILYYSEGKPDYNQMASTN